MTPAARASLNFQAPYPRGLTPFRVCPHCKEPTARFLVTCDDHRFETDRCPVHGDVIAVIQYGPLENSPGGAHQ